MLGIQAAEHGVAGQAQPTAPLPEHSQVMTLMGREAELRARMEQHRKQIEQKQLQDAIKACLPQHCSSQPVGGRPAVHVAL